jgi:predicted Ser/Thr protein kinase
VHLSTWGAQKYPQKIEVNPCQNNLAEKVERKKNVFPVVFSHRFFLIAFLTASLHEEPKNTTAILSKLRPENLKKSR